MVTLSLRKPSDAALSALLSTARVESLSYVEVGATQGELPGGYRHDRFDVDLGPDGDGRFERARDALRAWRPQVGAGLRVVPSDPVHQDQTFVLVMHFGPLYVLAPGRVVTVIDTPERFAFAYGTLQSHPEKGEESFAIARDDGRVLFTVVAFSRPRHVLARLGAPVARLVQRRVTRAYLAAMQADAS
ncbi:MAG TPA: DUF1990 domain-containing protein [Acidimicrobiales bacterium]